MAAGSMGAVERLDVYAAAFQRMSAGIGVAVKEFEATIAALGQKSNG